MRVLHITPHLGGGVGRVLLSWLARARDRGMGEHTLCCLEEANPAAAALARRIPVALFDRMAGSPGLRQAVAETDVVVVHWWNHPLLYRLLAVDGLPACRCALWSHVSGFAAPQIITSALTSFPHRFVLATPYSLEVPAVRALDDAARRERLRVVFTCAGTGHVDGAAPAPHDGLVVGYVGTVDYAKLHPSFLSMSGAVSAPGVRFVVCGGPSHERLRDQAAAMGLSERFEFTGPVDDVAARLAGFDVFGYPLRRDHYGTGEQALIEAMAAGLPVVVFDNGCERHLVEHGRTGLVVSGEREYAEAIERLCRDAGLRSELGGNARARAHARFSLDTMVERWDRLLHELAGEPKRPCVWPGPVPRDGASLFLAALGEASADFADSMAGDDQSGRGADQRIAALDGAFRAPTRGSPFHYRRHYPQDPWLNHWCGLLESPAADGRAAGAPPRRETAPKARPGLCAAQGLGNTTRGG